MARLWRGGAGRGLTLLAGLVVVDALTTNNVVLIGFFGLAPLLAGSTGSVRQTMLVGAAAVAAAIAAGTFDGNFGSTDHLTRCVLVLVLSAAGTVLAAIREARERKLTQALKVAEVAQQAILHPLPSRVGSVATSTTPRTPASASGC